jgi:hypothetical protein
MHGNLSWIFVDMRMRFREQLPSKMSSYSSHIPAFRRHVTIPSAICRLHLTIIWEQVAFTRGGTYVSRYTYLDEYSGTEKCLKLKLQPSVREYLMSYDSGFLHTPFDSLWQSETKAELYG